LKTSFDVEVGYKSTSVLNAKEGDVNSVVVDCGADLSLDVFGLGLD